MRERVSETQYRCLCSCGTQTVVKNANLHKCERQSCGCLHREAVANGLRQFRLDTEACRTNGTVWLETPTGWLPKREAFKHWPYAEVRAMRGEVR